MPFVPDYNNIVDAAYNRKPRRIPLYEHSVSNEMMERVLGKSMPPMLGGGKGDTEEYFRLCCQFYKTMGYDTVSYEAGIARVLPGGGALANHAGVEGAIKDMADFRAYPWKDIPDLFFATFSPCLQALEKAMPEGMKGIGGVGNGVFENVQDLTGYMNLCYIKQDDPELYGMLFDAVGSVMREIWDRFMDKYGHIFCCLRMGDDLGYKTNTLLSGEDITTHVIPKYAEIIKRVHAHRKPFLLHSCGCIFNVMDELIGTARIDAKHSNEDEIAPFDVWMEKYGDRIGLFGGVDAGVLCDRTPAEIKEYVVRILEMVKDKGGVAVGSGNSIPAYIPKEGYLAMVDTIRSYRGE